MRTPSHRLKIERAKEHIDYLVAEIIKFRDLRPYRAVFDENIEKGHVGTAAFAVEGHADIPVEWGAVLGEIVYNCRSSLENASFVIEGRPDHNHSHFPFKPNAEAMEAAHHGKKESPRKTAMQALFQIKADKTWGPLTMLAALDDLNKHKTIILCGARLAQGFRLSSPEQFFSPLEEGAVFTCHLRDDADKVDMEKYLPFEIAFAEAKITKGDALMPTLENLLSIADSVVSAFIAKGLIT